jgi:hypothetical protein
MKIKSWLLLLLTHRDKGARVERGKRCKSTQGHLMLVDIKLASISLLLCNLRRGMTTFSSRWTMTNLREISQIRCSSTGNLLKIKHRAQVTINLHPNYLLRTKGFQTWQIWTPMNSLPLHKTSRLMQVISYSYRCPKRMCVEARICQEKTVSFLQLIKTVLMEPLMMVI